MAEVTQDQIIRHLLGDLGSDEEALVDEGLRGSAELASLAESYGEAFTAYAVATSPVREPRRGLGDQIMAAIAPEGETAPVTPARAGVERFPFLPWAVAACVALFAGLGFLSWRSERQMLLSENRDLRERAEKSDLRVRELASQVDESFKAFIVWDESRSTGVHKVDNLPELGAGGDYQLWVVSEGYEHPLDGGVFDTDGGKAELQIVTKQLAKDPAKADAVTLFAISRERPGGVPISETKDFVLTAAY